MATYIFILCLKVEYYTENFTYNFNFERVIHFVLFSNNGHPNTLLITFKYLQLI